MDQWKYIKNFSTQYDIRIVYDIGAYNGDFTKILDGLLSAEFYMFEANPKKNKPKGLGLNCSWYNTVLSNSDDKEITWYDNATGSSYYIENPKYTQVEYRQMKLKTKRLTTLINEKNIPLPDLIKIDTQGSELDILEDCQDILNHCKLIHCEIPAQGVEPYVGTPSYEEYMKFFNDNGFIYSTRIKDHMINRSILVQHDYFFMKEIVQ